MRGLDGQTTCKECTCNSAEAQGVPAERSGETQGEGDDESWINISSVS